MKTKMKIALCVVLVLFAAVSMAAVLGSLGVLPASSMGQTYLLKEHGGYIAVFCPPESEEPMRVTDIQVRSLPLGDQVELRSGVSVSDYSAVVRLLEDYGA